jgi:mono/diheme cytochrome c family protein
MSTVNFHVRGRPRISYILLLAIAGALVFVTWALYRLAPESAPIARGAKYAQIRGCIECHGQPDNPYADANDEACSDQNHKPWHPEYKVDCADVLAYFETVRLGKTFQIRFQSNSQNLLITGEQLARRYHCFNCHGQLGQGGFKNSRSFKGYVPGYFGKDFKILTENGTADSVRQWIMYGVDPAILNKPILGRIAKAFFERQAIHMPSFKSLESEEIDTLVNYVIALNQYGPMTASMVRSYARDSVATSVRIDLAATNNLTRRNR